MLFALRANPQFALFWIQIVPVSSGKVIVRAAVAADPSVVKKLVVPANCKLPLLRIVNLVAPDLEAVNRSPAPVLSTTRPANEVVPETEATDVVPEFPRTSRVAR